MPRLSPEQILPYCVCCLLASCSGAPHRELADARRARTDRAEAAEAKATAAAPEVIELPEVIVPPMPPSFDVVVAEHETTYRRWGRYRGRARNVELAAELLDGATIEPGEVLSFNDRVGPRTGRAGFRRAPVILAGELTDGLGGGVCQVASTLHAAAWHGGLDVVEHHAHSRPSAYVRMGLDATVSWPELDLVVQNPFDFPVRVEAAASGGRLTVRILGADRPREVESELRVLSRSGHGERIVEDPSLPSGTREITQEGIRGAVVERIRVIREDGDATTALDVVRYPATDRILRVGTGAPAGALAFASL
jgi:vancomycin resistance protein YoaR